jgi:hypothetical protein
MPLTLAQYEAQIAALLMDPTNAVFSTAVIDAALRQALGDYTQANPLTTETVLTLPGDGREIALNGLSGLIQVTDVWFPYDSDGHEAWPRFDPSGFRLWWDDGAPVLYLAARAGRQPQADDEMRIFYTKAHTIQNLDSGDSTTVLPAHEFMLVRGAAGLACIGRAADLNETSSNMAVSTPNYAALGKLFLFGNEYDLGFYPWLALTRTQGQVRGDAFPRAGWQMDKHEVNGQ